VSSSTRRVAPVWLFVSALVLAAVVLWGLILHRADPAPVLRTWVPWTAFALVFFLAEASGVHLQLRREAHTLGGDEFAVLLESIDRRGTEVVAESLLKAMRRPFDLPGRETAINASIGIAAASSAGSADELLRNADVAMYSAKESGKHRFAHYDPSLHAKVRLTHDFALGLRKGLERNEIGVAKTFVDRLLDPTAESSFIDTFVRLSASLGIECIAEGIEQASQVARLLERGCTLGQGYHFSSPMRPTSSSATSRRVRLVARGRLGRQPGRVLGAHLEGGGDERLRGR
jgi:predicted signal transduction protein with EAL and GGDEF domain